MIFAIILTVFSMQAQASGKVDPQLLSSLEVKSSAEVIVFFEPAQNLASAYMFTDRVARIKHVKNLLVHHAEKSQQSVRNFLDAVKTPYRSNYLSNSIYIEEASIELIRLLENYQQAYRIIENKSYPLSMPEQPGQDFSETIPPGEIPAPLKLMAVDRVWNELNNMGEGIVIAGQDTGYHWGHEALINQYRGNKGMNVSHDYNWHDAIRTRKSGGNKSNPCGYSSPSPCDDGDHGTHTMGTMIGFDGKTNRIGVAPKAKWIGCRNMDEGMGTPASYLECFEFFLAPYPRGGNPARDGRAEMAPHIINNSWGCPSGEGCKGEEFLQAVRALKAAGIFVVVSAGNDGPTCRSADSPPGYYSGEVLSVGAMDHRNGEAADFSSRGPSRWNDGLVPNITAPGVAIRSAVPGAGWGGKLYDYKSGTSMSGPHVAGAIALIWAARPDLRGDVDATMQQVFKTATAMTTSQSCGSFPGGKVPNAVFGYGLINPYKAITAQ